MVKGMTLGRRTAVLCWERPRKWDRLGIGGGLTRGFGERRSGTSVPLTLMGKRPLARFVGGMRGVSTPSDESSPPAEAAAAASASIRPFCTCCLKNFLIFVVTVTSFTSGSLGYPSTGGLLAGARSTSLGGKLMGLPSSLIICNEPISARQTGSCLMRFFCTAKTFSEVSRTISGGSSRSWFRPRSRISRDFRSQSYER